MSNEFLYKLKLVPSLLIEENWTEREHKIVNEHFHQLKSLVESGKVVFAGRTLNMDPEGFGIVLLNVESEQEAKEIMESDPAVKSGIMTSSLFPFHLSLSRL
jgi:uncharacterized protein